MVKAWIAKINSLYFKEKYESCYQLLPEWRKEKADRLRDPKAKAQSAGVWTLWMEIRKRERLPEDAVLCPMIDARRMEVYSALYDRALHTVRETGADIVDEATYQEYLEGRPMYFFGDGAEKCKAKITHPNAHFMADVLPLARYMGPLAERAMAEGRFEDVAYFEPFYLKEFIASKPKKLL